MQLTTSEARIVENLRKGSRWRLMAPWVLSAGSASLLAIAALEIVMLVNHLHEHGLAASKLLVVLSQSQHPSHVDILFVFVLTVAVPLKLLVALQCAFGVIGTTRRVREQQLLLRFMGETKNVVEFSSTDDAETDKQPAIPGERKGHLPRGENRS